MLGRCSSGSSVGCNAGSPRCDPAGFARSSPARLFSRRSDRRVRQAADLRLLPVAAGDGAGARAARPVTGSRADRSRAKARAWSSCRPRHARSRQPGPSLAVPAIAEPKQVDPALGPTPPARESAIVPTAGRPVPVQPPVARALSSQAVVLGVLQNRWLVRRNGYGPTAGRA